MAEALAMTSEIVEWRHRLHRIPETGFEEAATSDAVAEILAQLGVDVVRGVGGTGLVATLRRGSGDRSIGLRADMDGLPIDERTGLPYASSHEGRMHACGHDGHMAMLLGAAARLAAEGGFEGTVHLVFQPAEEHGLGAEAMLADGLLERFPMQAMFGIHNMPGVPAGRVHTRVGSLMASEDNFEIRISGRGGHAARPQMVIDPIVVGAEIVLALQTIVARTIDPTLPAVVSCTEFVTDGARNAIPCEVVIKGDTRSFDPQVQALLESRMRELCAGIAAAHGAACEVTYTHEFEPTVNDAACVAAAVAAATAVVGPDRVDGDCRQWLASEDFGAFGRAVPACFVLLGNGAEPGAGGTPLHSRDYEFNDDVLDVGVAYYVELVRALLPEGGGAAATPSWFAHERDRTWACAAPSGEAISFHRSLDGYAPTPLVELPQLARELGVGHVFAKDESSRLGLPAFKALGASWAVHRALRDLDPAGPVTIVTATDGNHGRAVARFARLLGHRAAIVVPPGVHPSAVRAIADEGATVTEVSGSYDDAVAAAARLADEVGGVLVQDTAWEGYEQIPGWIVEGYATLFAEADQQLSDAGLGRPDLVLVPAGVGSLLQGALAHYRGDRVVPGTAVVSVEPEAAACMAPSLAAGRPVTVATGVTVMAGLNCGTPSSLAWPYIENGLDAAVAVSEQDDILAAHDLAALGVGAGPCGAAGLAGARLALTGDGADERRAHLEVGPDSVVVLVVTEGSAANPVPALEGS